MVATMFPDDYIGLRQLPDVTVSAGTPITLHCQQDEASLLRTSTEITYEWTWASANGKPTSLPTGVQTSRGHLNISNSNPDQSGVYTCVARDVDGVLLAGRQSSTVNILCEFLLLLWLWGALPWMCLGVCGDSEWFLMRHLTINKLQVFFSQTFSPDFASMRGSVFFQNNCRG